MRKIWIAAWAGALMCSAPHASAREEVSEKVSDEAQEIIKLFAAGGYLKYESDAPLGPLSVPPPAMGSAKEELDQSLSREALTANDQNRWNLAAQDAEIHPDKILDGFSNAAGIEFSKQSLPALGKLIRLAIVDFAASTSATKKAYNRTRPFAANGQPSCTPDWEPFLRQDGSYPSGHSAIGWGIALILSELIPDRSAEILARGQEFGDSRRFCNVHWHSDILAGQTMATDAFFKLKNNAAFQQDLEAAKRAILAISKY